MEITFNLTPAQWQTFQRALAFDHPRTQRTRLWRFMIAIILGALVGVSVGLLRAQTGEESSDIADIALGFGLGFISASLLFSSYSIVLHRALLPETFSGKEQSLVRLTDKAVESRSSSFHLQLQWPCITGMTERKDLLIIWSSTAFVVLIPISAFTSETEKTQFKAMVHRHLPRVE